MDTENKAATESKTKISEALITLIQEKPLEEITVMELIKKANVGKSTFYRHYFDMFNVFEELTDAFANRALGVMLRLVFSDVDREFNYEETVEFSEAMDRFGMTKADTVIVDYLFKTRSMKIFHLVVERFREAVKHYFVDTDFDADRADYYTRFVMNGILYSSLNEYKDNGTFSMELIRLLRSFNIDNIGVRGEGIG